MADRSMAPWCRADAALSSAANPSQTRARARSLPPKALTDRHQHHARQGHDPARPGFWTLARVEGWERCAIQGAKSLLTLFLVTDLLGRGGPVIGLAALRTGIEG
ncbi:hypothetical protein P0F65_14355 [Sphingomonas sp. I4]